MRGMGRECSKCFGNLTMWTVILKQRSTFYTWILLCSAIIKIQGVKATLWILLFYGYSRIGVTFWFMENVEKARKWLILVIAMWYNVVRHSI